MNVTPGEQLRARVAAEYQLHGCEPDGREEELIDRACATADLIADLERVLADEGPTTTGSAGQTVIHPTVPELRQQRALLLRLLAAIDFTDAKATSPSEAARHAARARWGDRPAPNNPPRALPEAK